MRTTTSSKADIVKHLMIQFCQRSRFTMPEAGGVSD